MLYQWHPILIRIESRLYIFPWFFPSKIIKNSYSPWHLRWFPHDFPSISASKELAAVPLPMPQSSRQSRETRRTQCIWGSSSACFFWGGDVHHETKLMGIPKTAIGNNDGFQYVSILKWSKMLWFWWLLWGTIILGYFRKAWNMVGDSTIKNCVFFGCN